MQVAQVLFGKAVLEDLDIAEVALDQFLDVAASAHGTQMAGDARGRHGETALTNELHGGVSFEISPHGFDDAFLFRVRHS